MFERVGGRVTFLKRVKFGFLNLDGLPTGEVRELVAKKSKSYKVIKSLMTSLAKDQSCHRWHKCR